MQWIELDRLGFEPRKFQRELHLVDISQNNLALVLEYSENAVSRIINGQWKQSSRWRRAIIEFTARSIVAKVLEMGWGQEAALKCAKRALQNIEFDAELVIEEATMFMSYWTADVNLSAAWIEKHTHPVLQKREALTKE